MNKNKIIFYAYVPDGIEFKRIQLSDRYITKFTVVPNQSFTYEEMWQFLEICGNRTLKITVEAKEE